MSTVLFKKTHDPVKIHQHVRKLVAKFGDENVYYTLLRVFWATAQAKAAEQEVFALIIAKTGIIPEGNLKSYEKKQKN